MNHMYANKFTISISESEAILRFCWILPKYENGDDVNGAEIAEEQVITLPRAAYDQLLQVMNDLEQKTSAK